MTEVASKLGLDPAMIRTVRELARAAGQPIVDMARSHSTVSVERAVLRLAGLDGADGDGMPWVNRMVEAVRETTGLEHGVALPVWDALLTGPTPTWSHWRGTPRPGRPSSGCPRARTRRRHGRRPAARWPRALPSSTPGGRNGRP